MRDGWHDRAARRPRLFYATGVEVGAPTGPGVNEESFWLAAQALEGREFVPLFVNRAGVGRHRGKRGPKGMSFLAGQWRVFAALLKYRVMRQGGDLMILRAGVLPFGAALALLLSGRCVHLKTVGDLHILDAQYGRMFPGITRRWVHALNLMLWRSLFRHATSADVCTPELGQILVDLFGRDALPPVWLIPNGIASERFTVVGRARTAQRLPVVGYLGGAPLVRGAKEVVELVRLAPGRGIDLRGLVAGSNAAEVGECARSRGVADKVHLCGLVPPAEVPALMGRLSIGLAMDDAGRHSRVGNSYQKVSQYLAAGCAVITTGVSDVALTSLGNVFVVPSADPECLLDAVERILQRSERQAQAAVDEAIAFVEQERCIGTLLRRRLDLIAGL